MHLFLYHPSGCFTLYPSGCFTLGITLYMNNLSQSTTSPAFYQFMFGNLTSLHIPLSSYVYNCLKYFLHIHLEPQTVLLFLHQPSNRKLKRSKFYFIYLFFWPMERAWSWKHVGPLKAGAGHGALTES